MPQMKMFDTGDMDIKIRNMSEYNLLTSEKINYGTSYQKITRSAANILIKYFNENMDALARKEKYLYHHVYEFDHAGDEKYRLFKPEIKTSQDSSTIKYNLTQSSLPNKSGHVFKNKTRVMEDGQPVTIRPRKSDVLVFDMGGETVFTKKEILIKSPGGNVAGSFTRKFYEFMNNDSQNVLKSFGFYNIIQKQMSLEAKKISYKINMGRINPETSADTSVRNISKGMLILHA